ncbi:MAG: metallophosphoesterase [Bacteroidota bacterium]|nr:metallophosphoesterase [Bacteroidota bacterium]
MRINFFIASILNFFAIAVSAQTILHSEQLGRPTNNSITMNMIFADSVEIKVDYGVSSGVYGFQTPTQLFPNNAPAEWILTNLLPNTTYYYRVNYRKYGTTQFIQRPEYHFQTQRSSNASFTFVVQADPHMDEQTDTAVYNRCLQNQLEDQPDFMIDLGDFLMTDKLKNLATNTIPHDTIPYRCNLLRTNYNKITHSVPLFIALGNHEGESGWNLNGTANNIAVWSTIERKKFFLNPTPNSFYSGDTINHPYVGLRENYYAWTWGNALFIVLDPYWYTSPKPDSLNGWRWTLGKTQYDWLKKTLESSQAKFKFIFAHQIIGGDPDGRGGVEYADRYEWGGNNLDGTAGFATNRPGWYKPIKDLLKENKATIFFHGHDHFFGKQDYNCLVYQETPQPSHPNFSSVTYAADYGYTQGTIIPNSGHIRVTVTPTSCLVEYVRAYKASSENATRHNKDISASYFINNTNCYDSINLSSPLFYNNNYIDELVYPNPSSGVVKISFQLPQAKKLSLSIYNNFGQIVKSLIDNEYLKEGAYTFLWDAKNNSGQDLPNGLYLLRANTDNELLFNNKITLQK